MRIAILLYIALMIAFIVGMDLTFFRGRFWGRLIANSAVVLVFAAFYLAVLRR